MTCEGLEDSQKSVVSLIENELKLGIRSNNIIIGGFSQGGALALYTALQYPKVSSV
jgi:predicted esterase